MFRKLIVPSGSNLFLLDYHIKLCFNHGDSDHLICNVTDVISQSPSYHFEYKLLSVVFVVVCVPEGRRKY